jgi:hypothetical protein
MSFSRKDLLHTLQQIVLSNPFWFGVALLLFRQQWNTWVVNTASGSWKFAARALTAAIGLPMRVVALYRRLRGRDVTVAVTGWRMKATLGAVSTSTTPPTIPLAAGAAGRTSVTPSLTTSPGPSIGSRFTWQPPSPNPQFVNNSQWVYAEDARRLEEAARYAMAATMPRFPVALLSPPSPSGSFSTYGTFPANWDADRFH